MTSAELLSVVTTIAIVLGTLFACIALFYAILILRRIYEMMDAIENFLKGISDGANEMYRRICMVKDSIDVVSQGMKAISTLYQSRSERKKSTQGGSTSSGKKRKSIQDEQE